MTPEVFSENYNKVKDLIKGHGPEIANNAGLSYATYFNVVRGLTSDPEKLQAAWTAIKAKADELMDLYINNI